MDKEQLVNEIAKIKIRNIPMVNIEFIKNKLNEKTINELKKDLIKLS